MTNEEWLVWEAQRVANQKELDITIVYDFFSHPFTHQMPFWGHRSLAAFNRVFLGISGGSLAAMNWVIIGALVLWAGYVGHVKELNRPIKRGWYKNEPPS